MRALARIIAPLLALLLAAGCEVTQPTQIILVVDTNLRIPEDIDRMRIKIEHMGLTVANYPFELDPNDPGSVKIPATMAIKAGKDPSLPVVITVTGFLDQHQRVIRRARLPFAVEREVMLRMNLLRSCFMPAKKCQGTTTCTASGCKGIDIDPATLPDWDEGVANKGLDASPPPPDMGPDTRAPDGPAPDMMLPDLKLPDQAAPDQAAPDQAGPDQSAPDQSAPDQSAPDQSAPDIGGKDLTTE